MRAALLAAAGWVCSAAIAAQAPSVPPIAPAGIAASAVPAVAPPGGRLMPLPVMDEPQLRELAGDLATQLEIAEGYRRVPVARFGAFPPFPQAVTPAAIVVRGSDDAPQVVRIGHVVAPRRLPQLWVQAYTLRQGRAVEADTAVIEQSLKTLFAERAKLFARLKLSDLETKTLPLSYVDADAALFALRAMGYSVITDSERLAADDSYRGDDVAVYDAARAALAPPAVATATATKKDDDDDEEEESHPAAKGGTAAALVVPVSNAAPLDGLPDEEKKRFLPRFPAIRNLPTTISMDRLPLIVKLPSTERANMGLVGGELNPAQRDQSGLTVIPSAASPLAETVTGSASDLLVLYHPAHPEQLRRIRRIVEEKIDRPARQVYVEGLVLEISNEGLKQLGVQWDIRKGNQSFQVGTLTDAPGVNAFTFLRDPLASVTPSQITARINALVQANKAEILSRPSVMTLDNRQATIRVGTDIPVATSKDAGADGNGSSRVAFSFQYIPTGILLNVRPRVSEDLAEISMLIDATVSSTVPGQDLQVLDPATKIALASAPTIATRRVQTYARILDNQPLIIGGLMSRNQIKSTNRVPLLGDIPYVGKLFGYTQVQDDRREVIIVLTPSIVTENIRETKAQYPKDDDRFDIFDTALFKEHHRIRAEDLVDSSDIRFNVRFRRYKEIVAKLAERDPALASKRPFSLFVGNRIPGEFYFITGEMYRMLDRLNAGDDIRVQNLKFFERNSETELRPVSVTQVLARYGDGVDPMSFFARNPGKALALTFELSRASMSEADIYSETTPEVRLVDCPDRATWRQMLWDLSRPNERGVPRYTILIQDPSDLRRLQLAYATQNTVLNNGGVGAMIFDKFLVGRMLHLQEVTPTWERIVNGQIAQYFFIGEHFYMFFIEQHQKAMQELEQALKSPDVQAAMQGAKLP